MWHYSWVNLVARLGTTTLSIFIFSFCVPVLIFALDIIMHWREERRRGKSVKLVLKGALLSWGTIVPTVVYVVVWCSLIAWSLASTASADHNQLLARIRQLKSEEQTIADDAKKRIADLSEKISKKPTIVYLPRAGQNNGPDKATIDGIAQLADRGTRIQEAFVRTDDTAAMKIDYEKWLVDAVSLLTSQAGTSYAVQFKNAHGSAMMGCPVGHPISGCGYWQEIQAKRTVLMDFITELRQPR